MSTVTSTARRGSGWILSPRADVWVFSGPVLFAIALVLGVRHFDLADEERFPPWAFLALVVGCDVAHVYATGYRMALDRAVWRRNVTLFVTTPLIYLTVAVFVHERSPGLFWTLLAYLAVWHFARQQWGWIAATRRNGGETSRWGRHVDHAMTLNLTLVPIIWWHARLPREFVWFRPGDFVTGLPVIAGDIALMCHALLLGAYILWTALSAARGGHVNWAKIHIFGATWVAWFFGIVVWNDDLAFTAMNVLSHGVPYLVMVHRVERSRPAAGEGLRRWFLAARSWPVFVAPLLLAAWLEESAWDRWVWHTYPELFPGSAWTLPTWALALVVPMLALPQATHYLLDGWLWRSRHDPHLVTALRGPGGSRPSHRSARSGRVGSIETPRRNPSADVDS